MLNSLSIFLVMWPVNVNFLSWLLTRVSLQLLFVLKCHLFLHILSKLFLTFVVITTALLYLFGKSPTCYLGGYITDNSQTLSSLFLKTYSNILIIISVRSASKIYCYIEMWASYRSPEFLLSILVVSKYLKSVNMAVVHCHHGFQKNKTEL